MFAVSNNISSRIYQAEMKLVLVWVLAAVVAGVQSGKRKWYESAVIYQIYPRSFLDTDGDGIGDLSGIIKKADYFHSLGVDAIWLSPIFPSPNVDYGYDISDYMDINPEFGTLNDFDILVKVFKDRGIRVILDFVPNHSSTEHKWFKMSEIKNDTETNYSNFYVWKDAKGVDHNGVHQPPNNWLGVMNTGSAWKWSEKRQQFYLHNFFEQQADLNFNNPNVRAKMLEVLKFWMKRRVAGFGVDAVSWLFEDPKFRDEPASKDADPSNPNDYNNLDHIYTLDQAPNFGLVEEWRALIDEFTNFMEDEEDRVLIVESHSSADRLLAYYGTGTKPGATFPFNFVMVNRLSRDANAKEWATAINKYYTDFQGHSPNWVLGSPDERRVTDRWSEAWVDLLHLVMLTLRGTAVSYYGEEIGLSDNSARWDQRKDARGAVAGPQYFAQRSRDFERGPMPWTFSSMAGFTNSSSSWLPLASSYWRLNVEAQEKAERSHLKVYRALVQLRKSPTLARGDCEVRALDHRVLFIIRSQKDNPTVLTAVNIGDTAATVSLHDARSGLPTWVNLLVASVNFPDQNKDVLKANNITLPAKSGIVVATAVTN